MQHNSLVALYKKDRQASFKLSNKHQVSVGSLDQPFVYLAHSHPIPRHSVILFILSREPD